MAKGKVDFELIGYAFLLLILIGGAFSIPFWAYDKTGTTKVLESQGYTAIEIKGYGWFACSEGDIFSTGFKATNSNNNIVEGTACRGLFKNTTIRFN